MGMTEQRVKAKRKELTELQNQLKSVMTEVDKALVIASETAACCESSLIDIRSEVSRAIENTKSHLKHGLLHCDVIKKGA